MLVNGLHLNQYHTFIRYNLISRREEKREEERRRGGEEKKHRKQQQKKKIEAVPVEGTPV